LIKIMSIDELAKKMTIDFPRPVSRVGAEVLLSYIAGKLPGRVNGKIDYFINYIFDPEEKDVSEDKGTLSIVATLVRDKNVMASDAFESKPWKQDTSYISGITFQRVPDWDLPDYRKEVQELWDDIRKIIGNFFSEYASSREL
jgi:hypothetical protein